MTKCAKCGNAERERDEARALAERLSDEYSDPEPLPWLPCGAGVFIGHSNTLYTCTLSEGHEGPHRCDP